VGEVKAEGGGMKIGDHAHGQWPKIIGRLLGEEYIDQRKHKPCPKDGDCGKGTPPYRFSDRHGTGNYFCRCSDGKEDGFALLMCVRGYDFKTAVKDVESVIGPCPKDDEPSAPRKPTFAERLRSRVVKAKASAYLASRGLEVAPGLDWMTALSYVDEDGKKVGEFPAMLAPVMRGGKFLTYHVTYLNGGRKLDVRAPRKILPAESSLPGASVPLYEAAEVMGVAEGVETAIAAKMMSGVPTWAALNTALLQSWEPPEIARKVFIFADNDANYAGQAAAYRLAHRLVKKGLEVVVEVPGVIDSDWNDALLSMSKMVA